MERIRINKRNILICQNLHLYFILRSFNTALIQGKANKVKHGSVGVSRCRCRCLSHEEPIQQFSRLFVSFFFQRNKQDILELQAAFSAVLFHPKTQRLWFTGHLLHSNCIKLNLTILSQGSPTRKRICENLSASESAFERWGGDRPFPRSNPTAPSSPPSPSPWKESGGPQLSSWREPTWWPANAQGCLLLLQSVKLSVESGWAAPLVWTLHSKELAVSQPFSFWCTGQAKLSQPVS